jgi:hypothetical protein
MWEGTVADWSKQGRMLPDGTAADWSKFVGFEVLTPVVMKSTIFWDMTPWSPLSVNRCFGLTYRLHLQGWRISRACLLL